MVFKKIAFIVYIILVFYMDTVTAMPNINLATYYKKAEITKCEINNLKQQYNIVVSNITREIIIANKTQEYSSSRFSLEENNFTTSLYFKQAKAKENIWRNYCVDSSIKHMTYGKYILISAVFSQLDLITENNLEHVNNTQKSIYIAASEVSLYEYINTMLTVTLSKTKHYKNNLEEYQSSKYGASYDFYHNFYNNYLNTQIMLTTRYLHINTSLDLLSKLYIISVGPVLAIEKSYHSVQNYIVTLGAELGYLGTITTNKQLAISEADAVINKIIKDIEKQDNWYILTGVILKYNDIILGLQATCNQDKDKTLYGASVYAKFRF